MAIWPLIETHESNDRQGTLRNILCVVNKNIQAAPKSPASSAFLTTAVPRQFDHQWLFSGKGGCLSKPTKPNSWTAQRSGVRSCRRCSLPYFNSSRLFGPVAPTSVPIASHYHETRWAVRTAVVLPLKLSPRFAQTGGKDPRTLKPRRTRASTSDWSPSSSDGWGRELPLKLSSSGCPRGR